MVRIPGKKPWHRARVTSVLPLYTLDLIDGRIWIGPIDFLLLLGTGLPPNAKGGGGRDRTVYARISRESIQLFKTFLSGRGAL